VLVTGSVACFELDDATRTLRNRLAEQFAVPPSLVHRRLVSWPCHHLWANCPSTRRRRTDATAAWLAGAWEGSAPADVVWDESV